MKTQLATLGLLAWLTLLYGCKGMPDRAPGSAPGLPSVPAGSHRFPCHAASPGPCAYALFNESGSVRETFILAPGESRIVSNVQPRTAFCMAVEKPLDPIRCERLGLDGKPAQK